MNDLLHDNLKIPISHYIPPNSVFRPLKMFYYLSNASRFTNFSHAFRDHERKNSLKAQFRVCKKLMFIHLRNTFRNIRKKLLYFNWYIWSNNWILLIPRKILIIYVNTRVYFFYCSGT